MELNGYRLLLPEGTLDYFDLVDVKESVNEVVIYLEEKNIVPEKYTDQDTESKGFYDPVIVQDFPLRGKKVFLNIYNPQIEMFARFKMKSSFHKTKRII